MPAENPSAPTSLDALAPIESSAAAVVEGLAFPSNLEKHFILFKVKKRERETKLLKPGSRIKKVISLPIPSNLSTGYNAKYANMPIGPAGKIAQQTIASAQGEGGKLGAIADLLGTQAGQDSLSGAVKNIGATLAQEQLSGIVGGAIGGITGFAAGAAAGEAQQGALQVTGVARNPHLAVLFEGVDMRTHQFQYKFIPRNRGESDTLREIIKQFKLAMAPEFIESGHFFNYPDEFDIRIGNPDYLFKIGTSVLIDFQLNYTAQDGSLFHVNGAPVAVSLALTFQELDIITKAQIEDGR